MFAKYHTAAEVKKAINSGSLIEMTLTKATIGAREELLEESGYTIEESMSGYFRLLDTNGNTIIDDSACEDYYDRDSAIYFFLLYLADNNLLTCPKITKR